MDTRRGNREKSNGGSTVIDYGYDPGGNRTYKRVNNNDTITNTFYVRDAQGNVMGIYSIKDEETLRWDEQHLYGSSRLGMWRYDTIVPEGPPVVGEATSIYDSLLLGSRAYELSNHLGNVLSTISDKKIGNDSSSVVNYYIAEVLSQNDYYPGGMDMPGRQYNSETDYRYGFNGKEKENEGSVQYDYGFRIYDPRTVRFKSVDPLQQKYPGESPYLYTGGNPIIFTDPDGRDRIIKTTTIGKDGRSTTITRVTKDFFLYRKVDRPGFGNNTYYKADLEINFTVDLSKGTMTYHEQEGVKRHEISQGSYQLHRAGVFLSKIAGGTDSDNRGSQPGGLTLTSEFSTNGDGAKTDATEGSSGSVNIDLIMVAASSFGLPADRLGFSIKELPEWTSMVKDAVDAYKSIQEDQKSESDSKPILDPGGKKKQDNIDPNTKMYAYPPNKKGKIDAWHSDSSQTKPLWRESQKKNPKLKEPPSKKLGQF